VVVVLRWCKALPIASIGGGGSGGGGGGLGGGSGGGGGLVVIESLTWTSQTLGAGGVGCGEVVEMVVEWSWWMMW
jgi:hypothetical protein